HSTLLPFDFHAGFGGALLLSTRHRLHLGPVLERRVERPSALRRQVQHIPNRNQLIDATLFDVVGQPWMAAVKMTQRAVIVSRENRNRRVLMSRRVFAAEIVLKSAVARAQQTQSVPASFASIRAQRGRISSSDDRQVHILRQVMSDAIVAVDPGSTHRARIDLLLSKHEVIDHQRTIRRSEQLAQPYFYCRFISLVKRRWAFKKLVILNRCSFWQS